MGEADAAELAAGVGKIRLAAHQAALAVHLDDIGKIIRVCGGLQFHDMLGHLGAVEIGAVVDLGHEFQVLRCHGFKVSGPHHACVADEGVQCTEVANGGLDEGVQAVHVGYVRLYEDGAIAAGQFVEGGGRLLAGNLVQVGHHNVGAFLHQFAGNALAEALGCSRDDDGLAFYASVGTASPHGTAVILHLPVIDKVYPGRFHAVLSTEGAGVEGHFHGIQEDFRDDAGVLGVVTHGYQADAFDEQHLGGVAPAGDIGFDFFFGLGRLVVGVNDDVFALAIDDAVGREGCEDAFRVGQEFIHQGVFGNLQGLEAASAAGQDLPDGGKHFAHAVAHGCFPFREGGHQGFQLCHYVLINGIDLRHRIGGYEDAVVLQEDDLRLASALRFPLADGIIHLLEEGVTRIGIGYI